MCVFIIRVYYVSPCFLFHSLFSGCCESGRRWCCWYFYSRCCLFLFPTSFSSFILHARFVHSFVSFFLLFFFFSFLMRTQCFFVIARAVCVFVSCIGSFDRTDFLRYIYIYMYMYCQHICMVRMAVQNGEWEEKKSSREEIKFFCWFRLKCVVFLALQLCQRYKKKKRLSFTLQSSRKSCAQQWYLHFSFVHSHTLFNLK